MDERNLKQSVRKKYPNYGFEWEKFCFIFFNCGIFFVEVREGEERMKKFMN